MKSSCVVLQHCCIVLCCVTALLNRPLLCYSIVASSCVVLQLWWFVLCRVTEMLYRPVLCYSIAASSCVVLQLCWIVLCFVTELLHRPVLCYSFAASSYAVLQHCCIFLCCVTALLHRPVLCYSIDASSCVVLQYCCIRNPYPKYANRPFLHTMQHKRKCACLNAICYLGWNLWRFTQSDYYRRKKTSGFKVSFREKFGFVDTWCLSPLVFRRIVWKILILWRNQNLGFLDLMLCRWVVFFAFCREGQCVRNEKLRDPTRTNTSFFREALWLLTYRKMTLFCWTHPCLGNWMFWKFHISQSNYEIPQPGKPQNFRL